MMPIVLLSIFSFVGMSIILGRHLVVVRKMSGREFVLNFQKTDPVFWDMHKHIIIPFKSFWASKIKPSFFRRMEKILSKIRILLLVVENLLLRFNNYIHGKALEHKNVKKTEYWGNIDDFKKDLKTKKTL